MRPILLLLGVAALASSFLPGTAMSHSSQSTPTAGNHPEAASIGKFTKKVLDQHGLWEGFEPTVLFPTVNEIANAAKLGTIDAGIVWDAIAAQYSELDFVALPEFDAEVGSINVTEEQVTVPVPEVEVTTREEVITVPGLSITAPEDDGENVANNE